MPGTTEEPPRPVIASIKSYTPTVAIPAPSMAIPPQPSSLHVIDTRTGNYYNIPIEHNAVSAHEFKRIKSPVNANYYADQNEHGLRIYDPGFSNTAVSKSSVTYM